ncbi:Uncharacterised protein [Legionella donaldsonii]|uniref:Uncharacterized protein n=1 Tax=Legionella donaldsonii TaxID=45060 RepID=A0A378J2G4_9GAMM|nr:hypothetical protein [Legionella donaldsonii]STX41934.1 Uncharacterised protein [Legionella donaldsonii]
MEEILERMADFIDDVHKSLNDTADVKERAKRQEVFDSLLLLATYTSAIELEKALSRSLPLEEANPGLTYLCKQLREINGLCTFSFSDSHDIYRSLFTNIQFNNFDEKERLRKELSRQLTELIFEKTNTEIPSSSLRF